MIKNTIRFNEQSWDGYFVPLTTTEEHTMLIKKISVNPEEFFSFLLKTTSEKP